MRASVESTTAPVMCIAQYSSTRASCFCSGLSQHGTPSHLDLLGRVSPNRSRLVLGKPPRRGRAPVPHPGGGPLSTGSPPNDQKRAAFGPNKRAPRTDDGGLLDAAQRHGAEDEHFRLVAPALFVLGVVAEGGGAVQLVVFLDLGPVGRLGDFVVGKRHRPPLDVLGQVPPHVVGGGRLGPLVGREEDFDDEDVFDVGGNAVAAEGLGDLGGVSWVS